LIKLVLFPAFVAFVAFVLAQLVLHFVRSMRVNITDAMSGKAVHVKTPLGGFDLKPQDKLAPELARMLVYPGAAPLASQPTEYEAEGNLLGREFHVLVASYQTTTPLEIVWEFYRRELVDWREKQSGSLRSLVRESAEGTQTIRVHQQGSNTLIETRISLKPKTGAAAAGVSGPSDTRFGMLR
jgi:hypothetical protein